MESVVKTRATKAEQLAEYAASKSPLHDDFVKLTRVGFSRGVGSVLVEIKYKAGRLSISGVEGAYSSGDCKGSCGQIDMHPWELMTHGEGYTPERVAKLRKIWGDWHLNDMRAGTPRQTAALETPEALAHHAEYKARCEVTSRASPYRSLALNYSHYDWACLYLAGINLRLDDSVDDNGQPYKYGHGWLATPVPDEAIEFLRALPDAKVSDAIMRTWFKETRAYREKNPPASLADMTPVTADMLCAGPWKVSNSERLGKWWITNRNYEGSGKHVPQDELPRYVKDLGQHTESQVEAMIADAYAGTPL